LRVLDKIRNLNLIFVFAYIFILIIGGQTPNEEDLKRMVSKFIPTVLSSFQKYSNVIEGVSDTVKLLRSAPYNLKIGSTTGYPSNVLNILLGASRSQGNEYWLNIIFFLFFVLFLNVLFLFYFFF